MKASDEKRIALLARYDLVTQLVGDDPTSAELLSALRHDPRVISESTIGRLESLWDEYWEAQIERDGCGGQLAVQCPHGVEEIGLYCGRLDGSWPTRWSEGATLEIRDRASSGHRALTLLCFASLSSAMGWVSDLSVPGGSFEPFQPLSGYRFESRPVGWNPDR